MNPQPPQCECGALPLSYVPMGRPKKRPSHRRTMVETMGIEPTTPSMPWKCSTVELRPPVGTARLAANLAIRLGTNNYNSHRVEWWSREGLHFPIKSLRRAEQPQHGHYINRKQNLLDYLRKMRGLIFWPLQSSSKCRCGPKATPDSPEIATSSPLETFCPAGTGHWERCP